MTNKSNTPENEDLSERMKNEGKILLDDLLTVSPKKLAKNQKDAAFILLQPFIAIAGLIKIYAINIPRLFKRNKEIIAKYKNKKAGRIKSISKKQTEDLIKYKTAIIAICIPFLAAFIYGIFTGTLFAKIFYIYLTVMIGFYAYVEYKKIKRIKAATRNKYKK